MSKWHNQTGRPLSSIQWLKTHHYAKLDDRKKFLRDILDDTITTVVDLGCGPGLWMDIINELACDNVKLIGIDSDANALRQAKQHTKSWKRDVTFINCDMETEIDKIPKADLILAFNIFSFLKTPDLFLNNIKNRLKPNGKVIIRQYDGGILRFGPMDENLRQIIDTSLYASIGSSDSFHHYDMDRVYSIISNSSFNNIDISFETFQKTSPYSSEFQKYLEETIDWTSRYISDYAKEELMKWYNYQFKQHSYFVALDLVSILS
jgi:SAM-dependent methyltransferase